ncbi:hypothetical protein M2323_000436 [Rhodoblastus acidophilus]|uniref:hypothetical protein n=1 Tax=Rhodoblastus acidophilus TaxID=1074 RepID=UPI002223EF0D|nr:hypothetical protein [Rhodoblastus acidophilus]MCW2282675.1 hypothetical protein [Rhodoblastus acidophilus]MCW2331536.1 hypothetical protein [Rhodoblastus acidophilus]
MTAPFGRRNRAPAPSVARLAPRAAELALTPEQRAYLFAEAAESSEPRSSAPPTPQNRGAALIACAALTAVTVALGALGKHDVALQGMPSALEPMSQEFLALIGPNAAAFVLGWTVLITFLNYTANLWLTRKLAGALGLSAVAAYAGVGAVIGFAMAWIPDALGLGASEIGLGMEALAGAGLSGLYRLLCGPVRP